MVHLLYCSFVRNSNKLWIVLWKDADPGIAELEDSRKTLTGLKDQ
jgi:hypothetical protein